MKVSQRLLDWIKGRKEQNSEQVLSVSDSSFSAYSSQRREIDLLGEDRVKRQRYYEEWACRESWLVYTEALPLLMKDIDNDEGVEEQLQSAWEHLNRCVKQGLPPVLLNPADPPESWRAEPVELYRWAVAARIAMPAELESLLSFISTTVKKDSIAVTAALPNAQTDTAQSDGDAQLGREQVLDALLSLVLRELLNQKASSAEELRGQLLRQLYHSSDILFDNPEPPLSRPAIHDLLDRSLEKAITR
jgi:hypothetical protein